MKDIRISTAAQVQYKFNGFFEAASPDWIHMSRELMENEYLIMEPGQQFGFAPSLCTFYWLHFDCLFFGFKDEPVIFLPKQGQISSQNRIHNAFLELNNANFVYHDEQTNNMYTMQILLELYNQSQKKTMLNHSYRDYLLQNVKNYVKWNQAYHIAVFCPLHSASAFVMVMHFPAPLKNTPELLQRNFETAATLSHEIVTNQFFSILHTACEQEDQPH